MVCKKFEVANTNINSSNNFLMSQRSDCVPTTMQLCHNYITLKGSCLALANFRQSSSREGRKSTAVENSLRQTQLHFGRFPDSSTSPGHISRTRTSSNFHLITLVQVDPISCCIKDSSVAI